METVLIKTEVKYESEPEVLHEDECKIEVRSDVDADSDVNINGGVSSGPEVPVDPKLRVEQSTTVCSLISLTADFMQLFNYLTKFGLLADSYKCPVCAHSLTLFEVCTMKTQDGYMWHCTRCNIWRGLRKGTWFEESKLSIRVIVLLTYFFCWKSPFSYVCHELKVPRKTVVTWMDHCEELCTNIVSKWGKIGGQGVVVQVGETYFANKDDKRDDSNDKVTWVLGAVVSDGDGRKFVLRQLEKRDRVTLLAALCDIVEKGSEIYLSCCSGYGTVGQLNSDRLTAQYQLKFRKCKGDVCTAMVKRLMDEVRCNVKRGKSGVNCLQQYLDEYMWRKSVADNECIFRNFLRSVADLYVPKCED